MRHEIKKVDLIEKEICSYKGVQYSLELVGEKRLGEPIIETPENSKNKDQWWNVSTSGNSINLVKELGQGNGLKMTTRQYEESTMAEKKMIADSIAKQDINFLTSTIFKVRLKASAHDFWVTISWWVRVKFGIWKR